MVLATREPSAETSPTEWSHVIPYEVSIDRATVTDARYVVVWKPTNGHA